MLDLKAHEAEISPSIWEDLQQDSLQDPEEIRAVIKNILLANERLQAEALHFKKRNVHMRRELESVQGGREMTADYYLSIDNLDEHFQQSLQHVAAHGTSKKPELETIEIDETDLIPLHQLQCNQFDNIHSVNKNIIWTILIYHVQKLAQGHPFSGRLPAPFVNTVVHEVSLGARGVLGQVVREALLVSYQVDLFQYSDEMASKLNKLSITGELEILIKKCLQAPAG